MSCDFFCQTKKIKRQKDNSNLNNGENAFQRHQNYVNNNGSSSYVRVNRYPPTFMLDRLMIYSNRMLRAITCSRTTTGGMTTGSDLAAEMTSIADATTASTGSTRVGAASTDNTNHITTTSRTRGTTMVTRHTGTTDVEVTVGRTTDDLTLVTTIQNLASISATITKGDTVHETISMLVRGFL